MNRKDLNPDGSPRAAFGAHLRSSREMRGWRQEDLGERLGYSGTHVSAVETGRKVPTLRLARKADQVFGTAEAPDSFERRWRQLRQGSLLEGFPEYVGYEGRAVEIRLFEIGIIPGLLQTPDYAKALAESAVKRGAITDEQAQERLTVVAERQASLARNPSPLVFAVLDESCVRRLVRNQAVMDAQLARLVEFAELPNTVLQVVPFDMGAPRPFNQPIYILTMSDRSLASYAESAHQGSLERESTAVVPLLRAYHLLQADASTQAESVAFINQLRKAAP